MSKYRRPIQRQQRESYKNAYDPQNPRAIAVCDGCDLPVPHDNLRKHMIYSGGDTPVWDGFLVCPNCDDKPNPFFKRQVLPPDPRPIANPRPDTSGNAQFLATEEDDPIVTEDGDMIEAN